MCFKLVIAAAAAATTNRMASYTHSVMPYSILIPSSFAQSYRAGVLRAVRLHYHSQPSHKSIATLSSVLLATTIISI
jgi:hypothetical protein